MNTAKTTDSKEFFYDERTARIMLVIWAVLAIFYIPSLAFGFVRHDPVLSFILLLPWTWWAFYYVWGIWVGRRYPLFTLSGVSIEWGEPFSRKRKFISIADVINVEQVTKYVVVLRTTSKGSIRIPLSGLSTEDRQEIKELVESQFGVGEEGNP